MNMKPEIVVGTETVTEKGTCTETGTGAIKGVT